MIKSALTTICIFMLGSQPIYAREIGAQEMCKEKLRCTLEKSESILNNLHENEQQFNSGNPKLVRALGNQCNIQRKETIQILSILNHETQLAPHAGSVKNYLLTRLKGSVENEKIYEERASIENETFKVRLYIEGYTSPPIAKDLDVAKIVLTHLSKAAALKEKWERVSGNSKIQSSWFSPDSVYYSYEFSVPQTKLRGLLILENPLDYNILTEECLSASK